MDIVMTLQLRKQYLQNLLYTLHIAMTMTTMNMITMITMNMDTVMVIVTVIRIMITSPIMVMIILMHLLPSIRNRLR